MNQKQLEQRKMEITLEGVSRSLRIFGIVVDPKDLGLELAATSADVRMVSVALNNANRLLNFAEQRD